MREIWHRKPLVKNTTWRLCMQVTSTDLAEVCMTHLSSEIEDEAESALTAVNSICGLPMLPSERSALQQRLLVFLASSSDLTQRPLMRARVARAVIDNSGMNLLKLPQETCSVMHVCCIFPFQCVSLLTHTSLQYCTQTLHWFCLFLCELLPRFELSDL